MLFISDLMHDSSMIINKNLKLGIRDKKRSSKHDWPESEPSPKDRGFWMNFIHKIIDARKMIIHFMDLNHNDVRMLENVRHIEVIKPFHLPDVKWVKDNALFQVEEAFIQAPFKGELAHVAHASFVQKSYLALASWVASADKKILDNREFISSMSLEHAHLFAA